MPIWVRASVQAWRRVLTDRVMAGGPYPDRVDLRVGVVAVSGFLGFGLVVLGPVLVLLALKDGRDRRWVRRHPVTPGAGVRTGAGRVAVFGRTAPGRAGPVVAPLSGAEGVWYRSVIATVESSGENHTVVRVLWEETGGEPFGLADATGMVAVSGQILQASTFSRDLSVWAQTRIPVGSPHPSPVRAAVAETSRGQGPWLRKAIERGLVRESAVRGADEVVVSEDVVPAGVPLHVIGKPAVLASGETGLTLPPAGRYLARSKKPEETATELGNDSRYGLGCAIWAVLIGAGLVAICLAVAFSMAP
jgi:hypothetical protein